MEKGKTIPKYLTKFMTFHDELRSVGITIYKDDMGSLTLLGLGKSWNNYQESFNGRGNLPD